MEKMVLVPVAKLDAAIKQFETDGDYMMERELKEWITDAPVATIPLKKVPESCYDCPIKQFTQMECVYCEVYGGKENIDTHWENHTKPADCPIVTKE